MPILPQTVTQLDLHRPVAAVVNGRKNVVHNDPVWDAAYHPCAEAYPAGDIPQGTVTRLSDWSNTKLYAGTTRELWIYLPANTAGVYRVIVFNDGAWYLSRKGAVRATHVLDALHASGEIAPTAAVFINPGNPDHPVTGPIESYDDRSAQRSLEYDVLSPTYGQFLFDEVLPDVAKRLDFSISDDPSHRTLCGISSGGIAAFTAAWQHPHQCRRVISHCGSFTDIWGGHNTPSLIRHNARKPIRVFLQSGAHDANTPFGNWALANKTMASAFEWAGYDYRFEFGTGGHNLAHAGAVFADTLRWLWRSD